ncbi:uncharacterized protein MYCFIDRAFT_180284 [Pseudocercospora fijiensis CIRAD86]|uniref:Uncharacterized protein n=1 Tax=Pseudocercospora fijiensis (strain CIRAD86) TaxID=383855 RepID=M2YH24_PSEFD|nr:uncharacterized protein MYCFIDRAFT_180284 [Pseudocercospora fijiensis CIRAD86]EME77125.1 hypothetical protein MYCFIDRAFT_180284 [Pseudocercospora fijiensis CIRAD86]
MEKRQISNGYMAGKTHRERWNVPDDDDDDDVGQNAQRDVLIGCKLDLFELGFLDFSTAAAC